MNRAFNRAVIEHLLDIQHRDLSAGAVTTPLIQAAGDAIADILLDHGYRLERSFLDGRDVVHSYINPRTGEAIDDIGFTLELIDDGNSGANLSVLVRTDGASPGSPEGFSEPVRSSRSWYLPMKNGATASDLFALSANQKTHAPFQWRAAA